MPMRKRIRATFLWACLALLLVASTTGDYRPTTLDLAVAPYRYNLVTWELSHLPDKWVHLAASVLPWTDSLDESQRRIQAQEYFDLGRELQRLESRLSTEVTSNPQIQPAEAQVRRISAQRQAMQAAVEQTVESEISAILDDEGLYSRPGLLLPPVDVHFSTPPGVLVLSPRDRIFRQKTIVLEPGMTREEKEALEQQVLETEDLSALVVEIGGIATFPSIVTATVDLPRALEVVAHEWLHHWLFFKPLGQGFWRSPQMTTLNETVATIAGAELGARAYAAMSEDLLPDLPPELEAATSPDGGLKASTPESTEPPARFDAAEAIRETRLRTEELLARGEILEAEAYMEQRRQLLVAQGYRIRKINQAFFAFRESYATDPGSISPIDDQLRRLRQHSDSLEDFLRTVAAFRSYDQFLKRIASVPGKPSNSQ